MKVACVQAYDEDDDDSFFVRAHDQFKYVHTKFVWCVGREMICVSDRHTNRIYTIIIIIFDIPELVWYLRLPSSRCAMCNCAHYTRIYAVNMLCDNNKSNKFWTHSTMWPPLWNEQRACKYISSYVYKYMNIQFAVSWTFLYIVSRTECVSQLLPFHKHAHSFGLHNIITHGMENSHCTLSNSIRLNHSITFLSLDTIVFGGCAPNICHDYTCERISFTRGNEWNIGIYTSLLFESVIIFTAFQGREIQLHNAYELTVSQSHLNVRFVHSFLRICSCQMNQTGFYITEIDFFFTKNFVSEDVICLNYSSVQSISRKGFSSKNTHWFIYNHSNNTNEWTSSSSAVKEWH